MRYFFGIFETLDGIVILLSLFLPGFLLEEGTARMKQDRVMSRNHDWFPRFGIPPRSILDPANDKRSEARYFYVFAIFQRRGNFFEESVKNTTDGFGVVCLSIRFLQDKANDVKSFHFFPWVEDDQS